MEQPGLMMPLSPLENDEELDISPYWISPSSEKGNQPSSPIEPTGKWNRYLKDISQKDNCCSLLNPVWRNSPLDTGLDSSSKEEIVSQATVTMEVEQMGLLDPPYHPFDVEEGTLLTRPWGLAVNSRTEQVYVTDRKGDRILVFGPDGAYQGEFGTFGTGPGELHRPTGIAYDATHDRIYVVDRENHRVQAFCSKIGRFLFKFGIHGKRHGQLFYPWGIAVSHDGKYTAVTDSRNHRIQLFTHKGRFVRYYNIHAKKSLQNGGVLPNNLKGIVFDHSGQFLYVTDFNLNRILRLHIASSQMEILVDEQHLKRPAGITLDKDGNILVCDTSNHCIKVFRPNGQPVKRIVGIGHESIYHPQDISVFSAGQIALMDRKGRIQIFLH